MKFLETYKRLEKLCGEILNDDRRISAYIDEMTNTLSGVYFVSGWNEDLKQLKHYRWVRNQIAHNPDCTEENMCNEQDTQWISAFYTRIMNQTDPLSLYRKAMHLSQKQPTKNVEWQHSQKENYYETDHRVGCFAAVLIVVVIAIVVLWLF